jgi:hypothetical protein
MSRINPPIPMYMWHPPEESNPYCWLRTPQCYPLHQRGVRKKYLGILSLVLIIRKAAFV